MERLVDFLAKPEALGEQDAAEKVRLMLAVCGACSACSVSWVIRRLRLPALNTWPCQLHAGAERQETKSACWSSGQTLCCLPPSICTCLQATKKKGKAGAKPRASRARKPKAAADDEEDAEEEEAAAEEVRVLLAMSQVDMTASATGTA